MFWNRFDLVQVGGEPSSGFAVVFADFVEMVFGFVFAFAANFLNFAVHDDKEKKKLENVFNFYTIKETSHMLYSQVEPCATIRGMRWVETNLFS